MSTDWRNDPFVLEAIVRGNATLAACAAVEAYKRTLKTRIEEMAEPENRKTWDDGTRSVDSYAVKANQTLDAVLAVLEES